MSGCLDTIDTTDYNITIGPNRGKIAAVDEQLTLKAYRGIETKQS
jgi:hypothetical protein